MVGMMRRGSLHFGYVQKPFSSSPHEQEHLHTVPCKTKNLFDNVLTWADLWSKYNVYVIIPELVHASVIFIFCKLVFLLIFSLCLAGKKVSNSSSEALGNTEREETLVSQ